MLDEDDEFRGRVRDAVDRDDVGEAGWLLLDRPEGWEDRLGELLGEVVREADEIGSAEEAARLGRELTRAIEERDEAMAAARQARTEQDRAARTLTDERAGREAAEQRVAAMEQELASLREQRAEAVRDLKAFEVRSNARLDELKRAQADLAIARNEVTQMEEDLAGVGGPAVVASPGLADDDARTTATAPAAIGFESPVSSGSALDRDALAALVARAAEAAALLGASLAEAAELVRPADDEAEPADGQPAPIAGAALEPEPEPGTGARATAPS